VKTLTGPGTRREPGAQADIAQQQAPVEAAGRSDWPLAAGAIAGLIVAVAALLFAWSRTLGAPRAARVTIRGGRRARGSRAEGSRTWGGRTWGSRTWGSRTWGSRAALLASPAGSVVAKEMRAWWRDPLRTQTIIVALAWALGTVLLPLTFGAKVLLPWAGPAVALASACCCASLYAQDGTALWLTLLVPAAERPDVRGRQWAFLLVFAPVTIVIAVVFAAVSGLTWTWPWVLALTPALLGGGAGLLAIIWVAILVPGPDAHRRPDNPMDHGNAAGPANIMFWTGLLPAVPAVGLLLAGTELHNEAVRWTAVPMGVATGCLLAWWLGRAGARRLEARGPELLTLIRTGRSSSRPQVDARYQAERREATRQLHARGFAPVADPAGVGEALVYRWQRRGRAHVN